jgi:hypothetical protein
MANLLELVQAENKWKAISATAARRRTVTGGNHLVMAVFLLSPAAMSH